MGFKNLCFLLVFLCFTHVVHSANILALFSSLSFADHLVFRGYVSLLVQQNHSVWVMTPYPGKFAQQDMKKIIELDVGPASAPFWDEFKQLMTNVEDYYSISRDLNDFALKVAIAQLQSKPMLAVLSNPHSKFDLIVTEADVPLLYAVADRYDAPHIAITTGPGTIPMYESKGNPNHPLLYPDVNTLNYRNLSVWQKFTEIRRYLLTKMDYYQSFLHMNEVAAKQILNLERPLLEIEYDIDLLLVTGQPMLLGNRPTVPAIVYADHYHIKPGLALPKDLKEQLDGATNGFVYFSIGAVQDGEKLPKSLLPLLTDTFRQLSFLVLWKVGNLSFSNKPKNLVTKAWFPQQEILAHPNCKAFITHGGPRSLEEAIYYKVPIVGLPFVRSRKVFIEEITKFGAGEVVDPRYMDKQTLKETIQKVASDVAYKQGMERLNDLYEDRLMSGPETAVWWTEHVIRNHGAKHLRSPAVGLYFYQYYLLDIIALLSLITIFSTTILIVVVSLALRVGRKRIFRRESFTKFKAL